MTSNELADLLMESLERNSNNLTRPNAIEHDVESAIRWRMPTGGTRRSMVRIKGCAVGVVNDAIQEVNRRLAALNLPQLQIIPSHKKPSKTSIRRAMRRSTQSPHQPLRRFMP